MDGTILIADDDRTIRTVLTQALTRAGCRVHATASLTQLARWVEEGRGDLVITDVMMPDGNGIDFIPKFHEMRPELPVIVISANNSIVTTIRATEAAAFDYLPKPFDLPDLLARVRAGMSHRAAAEPAEAVEAPQAEMPLIGHAAPMQDLFRRIAHILNADLPVIIAGEAGSGRSLVARSLHDFSNRASSKLAVLTSHDADQTGLSRIAGGLEGGSLIIEDPAALSAEAQGGLSGLIEGWESAAARGGKPAPRLIAVMGARPEDDLDSGRLRSDLYWRMAGAVLDVPPLRRRSSDIPALAHHLLNRAAAQGMGVRELTPEAEDALRAHPLPGNLRQLDHLLRAMCLSGSGPITAAEVQDSLPPASAAPGQQACLADTVSAHMRRYFDLLGGETPPAGLYAHILAEVERPLIESVLDATGGNQLKSAKMLGINRNTLRKKLTELEIEVTRRRKLM